MNSNPDGDRSGGAQGRRRSLTDRLIAAGQLAALAQDLLPGGHFESGESRWHAGDVDGDGKRSLNVALTGDKAGSWFDHESGDRGDLVGLAARKWRIQREQVGDELERRGYLQPVARRRRRGDPARSHQRSPAPDSDDPLPPDDAPLPANKIVNPDGGGWLTPAHVWRYRLGDGRLAYCVLRYDLLGGGKEIRPVRWKGAGWVQGAYPAPRPLYRLPDLTARPDAPALVVEGEKTADRAASLFPDCAATTSAGGSKAARWAAWSALTGRDVLIIPDADSAGDGYAADVVRLARGVGASSVRIAPAAEVARLLGVAGDLPAGWDVADAPADAGPIALSDLLAVAADAAPASAVGGAAPPASANGAALDGDDGLLNARSATGDAARLLRAVGDGLLLAWGDNGDPAAVHIANAAGVWRRDVDALRAAHDVAARSFAQAMNDAAFASGADSDAKAANRSLDWALRTQSPKGLSDALQSCGGAFQQLRSAGDAAGASAWSVDSGELDGDARYVGAPNGVVDLLDGSLLTGAAARGKLVTRSLPDPFVPDATHPLIDRLLQHQDAEVADWLLTCFGLALRGELGTYILLIHGGTRGGKSTLVSALAAAMGGYAASLNAGTFTDPTHRRAGASSPDLELLRGRRLAYASESAALGADREWLKRLTGGEILRSRDLYQRHDTGFINRALLLLTANDPPRIGAHDPAIEERLQVAEWQPIPVAARDRSMLDDVKSDAGARQAMIALLVRSARDWTVDDWIAAQPASIKAAIAERAVEDTPAALEWARVNVIKGAATDRLTTRDLWRRATNEIGNGRGGVTGYPNQQAFTHAVKTALGLGATTGMSVNGVNGLRGWRGWRLRSPDDPASDDPAGQGSLDAGAAGDAGDGGDGVKRSRCAGCKRVVPDADLSFGDAGYCGNCGGGGAS